MGGWWICRLETRDRLSRCRGGSARSRGCVLWRLEALESLRMRRVRVGSDRKGYWVVEMELWCWFAELELRCSVEGSDAR
jgi:hypothetical protein